MIPWGALIGAGAVLGGSIMQGSAANKSSDRQWELLQQEMQRRNMLQGMIAPQLLHGVGIRNPQQVAKYTQQIGASPQLGGQASMVPKTPGLKGSSILGGLIGAPALNKIGAGRRTADLMTNPETGPEGQLVATLQNPNATPDEVQRAHAAYQQAIAAYRSAGGNQRKVAEQSLANQPLQQTIQQRLRELGLG